MSANGIAQLPSKAARKTAKLALAKVKRSAAGTPGYRPLHNLMATPQQVPLVTGRPWQ
jgi:hypothetical protein